MLNVILFPFLKEVKSMVKWAINYINRLVTLAYFCTYVACFNTFFITGIRFMLWLTYFKFWDHTAPMRHEN